MSFQFVFVCFAFLFSAGLCGVIFWGNLLKKVICLSVFSNSIVVFYLLLGFNYGSHPAIMHSAPQVIADFTNPLPSVLMLTAIVVGVSVQAIAFSLVIRIKKDFGTLDESKILSIKQT